MMQDKIREVGKALAAKQDEAKALWASFSRVKEEVLATGADLAVDGEAFRKLDEASKAYDAVCDEVNVLQGRYNRLQEMESGAPSFPAPAAAAPDHEDDVLDLAARFRASEAWAHIERTAGPSRVGRFGQTPGAELCDRGAVKAALMTTQSYPSQTLRRPGIVPLPQEPYTILDLIPFIPTESETVEYVYEKTFTNTAVETAEAEAATEGTLEFDVGTVTCKWIPFSIPTTRQLIADEPRMEAWINERLPRGVKTRLQTEVIKGDGLGNNLTGIVSWPNILSQDAGAFAKTDLVHMAKTRVIVASKGENTPNVILLHPEDNERLVLAKDAELRYYFGGPGYDGVRTIWGLLPIVHPAVDEGNPVVLDASVLELYVREGLQVSVSDSHADFFTKNKLMWLAQMRAALLVTRPAAICELTDFAS